eukprot:gene26733-32304_t
MKRAAASEDASHTYSYNLPSPLDFLNVDRQYKRFDFELDEYRTDLHSSSSSTKPGETTAPPSGREEHKNQKPRIEMPPPSSSSKSSRNNLSVDPSTQSSPLVEPSTTFKSCLHQSIEDINTPTNVHQLSPTSMPTIVLKRALSIQELDDDSWLTSPFISLVITRFARCYDKVRYLAADFVGLPLKKSEYFQVTDILGKPLDFKDKVTPIIFILNSNNIHWNLLRVVRYPKPELQLFEPLGLPKTRNQRVGLSLRSVPRVIIDWLNHCFPLPHGQSWLSQGGSAITSQQQLTTYDCGVACLLYAEKCGQGETKERINADTTQQHITRYREILQDFLRRVQHGGSPFELEYPSI